jgi:hypothetical protein
LEPTFHKIPIRGQFIEHCPSKATLTSVLLVNAYSILDENGFATVTNVCPGHVCDSTQAIAAKRQLHRHLADAVFADIEGKLARMRVDRLSIRNNHLRERHAIEKRAKFAVVVVCDC